MAIMSQQIIQAGEDATDAPCTTSPSNYTPTEATVGGNLEGIDTALASAGGGGPGPDYCPPSIKYKDADEVTVADGRYHKWGWRRDGQYQDTTNGGSYWDVSSAVDVDVDAPGTMVGGDVVSSWYSLWMTSASTFLVLPYIRVDTVTWNDPNTEITPANHDDGTTQNDNFVTSDDVFNTYILQQICDTAYHGTRNTIADCTNATPDKIMITGDVSSQIAAGEWLQMQPPSGTPCLYLGDLRFDGSGDLKEWAMHDKWLTIWPASISVSANKALSSSLANTDIATAAPPSAKRIYMSGYFGIATVTNRGALIRLYSGNTGSNQLALIKNQTSNNSTITTYADNMMWPMTSVGKIRNHGVYFNTSDAEVAIPAGDEAYFRIWAYEQ